MKPKFRNRSSLLYIGIFSLLLLAACNKVEDILDVPVYVDTDILTNSLTITFIDADESSPEKPQNLNIEIVGKDKDRLYSLLGEKDITATDNTLKIGIRKLEKPSPENPIEFTLIADAPGYIRTVRNFSVTTTDPVFTYVNMVSTNNLPQGISMQTGNLQIPATGLSEAKVFATSLSGSKQENASFRLREGTRFLNESGHAISGTFNVDYSHFDIRSDASMSAFPGGTFGDGLDKDGLPMGKIRFIPAGFGSFKMSGNTGRVARLTKPMEIKVRLSPEMLHPTTGSPLRAGDAIQLWTYEGDKLSWKKVQDATVVAQGGTPYAIFQTTTISEYWSVGFAQAATNTIKVHFHSNIDERDPERYYYVVIRNLVRTNAPFNQILFEGYLRLFQGEELFLNNVPNRGIALVEVYSAKFDCNDKKFLARQFFFWQANAERGYSAVNVFFTRDARINSNNRFPITVDVFGVCSDGDTVLRGVPTLDLQYSLPDCREYELLGRLHSGKGNTGALQPGKRYNFYFVHADLFRTLFDFPITTQDTTYRIESPVYNYYNDVFVDFDEDNNRIDFKWHNAQVPDQACDEYRRYY